MTANPETKTETKKAKKVVVSTSTSIKSCECKNEYQDSKYGKRMRVKNSMLGKTGGGYRCTVCGKEV